MTTDDQKLTEQIEAAFLDEKPWRAAVEAVMRYEGYTDEQIAEADAPIAHTDECADNGYPFGYDCTDEYGVDQHPFHTRSRELDCTYQLFFEESNLAAAVLPIIAAEVQASKAEAILMDGFDMAVADHLADAGYTEYAEDEDGGVTWVSAPLGEVLHIVRISATEYETGDRA